MVKIKIIRHSERLDCSHPFYWMFCFGHYWADTPLTSNGYKLAKDKGKELAADFTFHPNNIYTSPYIRTMATAAKIQESFPQSKIVIEPLMAEYQPYYKHRINLYDNNIPTTYEGQETDFSYPETYEDFTKRVIFIMERIMEKQEEDFIIVTHSEFIKVYGKYIISLYPDVMLDLIKPPYLSTLSFEYDKTTGKIVEESVRIE